MAHVCVPRAFVEPDLQWIVDALMFVAPVPAVLLGTTSRTSVGRCTHESTAGQFAAPAGFWAALPDAISS